MSRKVLLLVALVLALSACSVDTTYLPALLADPMADYEPDGTELEDSWTDGEGQDVVMDMPTHAGVGRTYRILDQTETKAVLDDAAAYAESQGWRLETSATSPDTSYHGEKELAPGEGNLGISLVAADPINDPEGPQLLRITLEYGSVEPDEATTSGGG